MASTPETLPATGRMDDRACKRKHGTAGELLSLVPAPAFDKATGDPFLTLTPRAAKAWLALFAYSRTHGTWRPSHVDSARPELAEGQQHVLSAHWTVAGLAYAIGANRDTAGKALKELILGGWVRREDPRNKGQFGGIDICFTTPSAVSRADKARVADGFRKRGVEYRDYEFRTAARILEDAEIERVRQDVELEVEMEKADVAEDDEKTVDLASRAVLRHRMAQGK